MNLFCILSLLAQPKLLYTAPKDRLSTLTSLPPTPASPVGLPRITTLTSTVATMEYQPLSRPLVPSAHHPHLSPQPSKSKASPQPSTLPSTYARNLLPSMTSLSHVSQHSPLHSMYAQLEPVSFSTPPGHISRISSSSVTPTSPSAFIPDEYRSLVCSTHTHEQFTTPALLPTSQLPQLAPPQELQLSPLAASLQQLHKLPPQPASSQSSLQHSLP